MKPAYFDAACVQRRLVETVSYDPATGVFVAKRSVGNVKIGSIRGNPDATGYLRLFIDGRQYMCHVLAWVYIFGEAPQGQIDHINGVKGDNRISNLRVVTPSMNGHNKPVPGNPQRRGNRYRARIVVNGGVRHLGSFSTASEARAAYIAAKTLANGGLPVRLIRAAIDSEIAKGA